MNNVQLEYFITLAKLEHMSHAAEELHVSQSALSTNLKKLEAELGVQLFDRKGRNLELNQFGRAFLGDAEEMVAHYYRAKSRLSTIKHQDENRIRIMGASLMSFPNLLERLHAACPDMVLSSMSCSYDEAIDMLVNDELDLCIAGVQLFDDRLSQVTLRRDELAVLVPDNHPLADREEARLIEFAGDSLADYPKTDISRSEVEKLSNEAGFTPNLAYEVRSVYEIIRAVKTGLYIALIPYKIMPLYNLEGTHAIRITDPVCYSNLRLYWYKEAREKDAARRARLLITDYFTSINSKTMPEVGPSSR